MFVGVLLVADFVAVGIGEGLALGRAHFANCCDGRCDRSCSACVGVQVGFGDNSFGVELFDEFENSLVVLPGEEFGFFAPAAGVAKLASVMRQVAAAQHSRAWQAC